ncbi:hypothetical protein VKT23_007538 [Stygiomarasmius scandens]|uniref:Uncharacterized protein n=1 Tax=Marasmiellus scandens TaxID=2682957 RepID=A0ABR1JKY6_9AGAR
MDIITLLNLQNFVPPELIPQHDHDDLLETVKALGREFLPERREFDDFSYLPENVEPNDEEKALVERFCHYVKSIHLALVASYIKACNEPFEEVRPFREGAFGIVYGNFFRWRRPGPHIDKSSQLQFAQCVSEFLANDTPTPDTSRSNIFWMILDQSFGNYTWITYPEAAEILLRVLQRKESGSASKNVQKEALCNHCRNILTDNQEMKMDSEETWI